MQDKRGQLYPAFRASGLFRVQLQEVQHQALGGKGGHKVRGEPHQSDIIEEIHSGCLLQNHRVETTLTFPVYRDSERDIRVPADTVRPIL